jgi:hypothetical protein
MLHQALVTLNKHNFLCDAKSGVKRGIAMSTYASGGRLSGVDVTDNDDVNVSLFLSHRELSFFEKSGCCFVVNGVKVR